MVALQTLKGINSSLSKTQSEISTGKTVASAKDNAAVWSISKVMESDVKGFNAISDSLALGESTVAVARNASETVTDLLTQMKEKIVSAQQANVDKTKIQADITALKDQITSVVGAAQFNGLNLVNGGSSTQVLSSLDRSSSGVAASYITVGAQDLSTGGYVAKAAFDGTATTAGVVSTSQDTFSLSLDASGTDAIGIATGLTWAEGDKISMTIGTTTVGYTVSAADAAATTPEDVIAIGLKTAIEDAGLNVSVDYNSAAPGVLSFTNDGTTDLQITGQFTNAGSGGLGALSSIDVTSDASGALGSIETLITTATNAAAAFGSAESRIQTQSEFVSSLTDSMKSGIGTLVDADMEEASARLQALQTQQQLGIQSLSIANQQPQNILSLFK